MPMLSAETLPAPQALWVDHVTARQAVVRAPRPVSTSLTARERSALRAALWTAIKANDVDAARSALEQGADPNQYKAGDYMRHAPLFAAVKNRNLDLVNLLLEQGADPNQKSFSDASIGLTLVEADHVGIAERLIAAGLRIGYPTVDSQDASDRCQFGPALLRTGQWAAPNLKTWWLEQGNQGQPSTYWARLPVTPPLDGWADHLRTARRDSPWAGWFHTATHHRHAPLAQALNERVLGWSALEAAGHDPRAVWAPMIEAPWNDAVLADNVETLEWLVAQRWTPASLCNELGIAWAWTALTSNATNAYTWLIGVPGMATQMQQDVSTHPSLTLHRPVERANRLDAREHPFTGWTVPMLNRLARAGVDVGAPNAQGDTFFHHALFAPSSDRDAQKTTVDEAANGALVTWLTRFRPDLISIPGHEGLDLLALGDRTYSNRADWLPQRAQMERAVLRGMADEITDEVTPEVRVRRRL